METHRIRTIVKIEHERLDNRISTASPNSYQNSHVRSLDQNGSVALLRRLHERYSINRIFAQLLSVLLKLSKLLFDVVLEEISIALSVAVGQTSKFLLEQLGVEDIGQSNATSLLGFSKHSKGVLSAVIPQLCSYRRVRYLKRSILSHV